MVLPETAGDSGTKPLLLVTDDAAGSFDFRSVLRKTNFLDVNKDERQHQQPRAPEIQQIDFRSVLRRKAIS